MGSIHFANILSINKKTASATSQFPSTAPEYSESGSFKSILSNLLGNHSPQETEINRSGSNPKNTLSTCRSFREAVQKESSSNQCSVDNAKIQARLDMDIKRLASFMGIGPKILQSVLGKLNIDPNNYDFNVETNVDRAVKSVADYFGISPMTLLAIFDKVGIKPEDLENKKKTGEVISTLKELLGLNIDQEKELADILAEFIKKEE